MPPTWALQNKFCFLHSLYILYKMLTNIPTLVGMFWNLVTIHLVTFTWYGDKWKLNNKNADNNNIRNSADIKGMETNAKHGRSEENCMKTFMKSVSVSLAGESGLLEDNLDIIF